MKVLPTFADRHAITIWYYDQTEREHAVKKAKEEGTASKVATASEGSQQIAKVLRYYIYIYSSFFLFVLLFFLFFSYYLHFLNTRKSFYHCF